MEAGILEIDLSSKKITEIKQKMRSHIYSSLLIKKNSVNRSEIHEGRALKGTVVSLTLHYHDEQIPLLCNKLAQKKAIHLLDW